MPTGYTHAVAEGKITTLREFALSCARGMGALITMRDDPHGAPIPEQFEPDTKHYDEVIVKAKQKLNELYGAGQEVIEELIAKENAEAIAYYNQRLEKYTTTKQRYEDMIAKVDAWEGAPEGLKELMLQQLFSSLEFDCYRDPSEEKPPEPIDPQRWFANEVEDLQNEVKRYTRYRQEEIDRVAARNAWLAQLHKSLENLD